MEGVQELKITSVVAANEDEPAEVAPKAFDAAVENPAQAPPKQVDSVPTLCQEAPPPTLEKSLLASQIDPKLRSGIQFTSFGNSPEDIQPILKNSSKTALLFQRLLQHRNEDGPLREFRELGLNAQFSRFIQSQSLTYPKFTQIRWQVCVEILFILRKSFPKCDACVFGSLANELADEQSNIDFSFDPHGDNYKTIETSSFKQVNVLRSRIAGTLKKYEGETTYLQQTSSSFQYKTRKLTHAASRKVTVLQINLPKLGFTVELYIESRLFVRNTKLLQFYLNYDPMVKHLILFLRYWAKFHGLIGNTKLKQYAINLLVLVYLTKEKIVPSVILLQTLAEQNKQRTSIGVQGTSSQTNFQNPEMVQGWDTSFCEDLELIHEHFKPSKKTYSINQGEYFLDLLSGFIVMITEAKFESEMFCPNLGIILPYKATSASKMANDILVNLPQTRLTNYWRRSEWLRDRNMLFSALTIQDPFQLDANAGRECSLETLEKFKDISSKTLQILRGRKPFMDIFVFIPAPQQATPTAVVPPKAIPTTASTPPSLNIPSDHLPTTSEPSSPRSLFQTLLETKQVPKNSPFANQFQNLPWDDQLLNFYQCQELTPAELQLRKKFIFDNILNILQSPPPNPKCNATIFGSLLTGLADLHSNIDISVDPYGDNYETLESCSPKERSRVIRNFQQRYEDMLKQAKSSLGVSQVNKVGKSVVRFQLTHTNLWVDLSIGNQLSVQNSKLIEFYLNYDPRVKDLILFLRYWAKFHEVSGSMKINQYAFSLLVLVYLTKEKIIPSVMLLQTLADIQRVRNNEGYSKPSLDWDSSFCSDLKDINDHFIPDSEFEWCLKHPSQKEYSSNMAKCFLELLKGFFTMIQKTDFSKDVVCPLFGKIVRRSKIEKTAMESLNSLEDLQLEHPKAQLTEWRKKQLEIKRSDTFFNTLTIQDPFQLDFNVGKNCSQEILDRFVRASMATLQILEGGPGSLLDLFVELPRTEEVKKATKEEVTPKSSQVTPVLPKAGSSSMSPQSQVPQTAPTSPKPSTSTHQ